MEEAPSVGGVSAGTSSELPGAGDISSEGPGAAEASGEAAEVLLGLAAAFGAP